MPVQTADKLRVALVAEVGSNPAEPGWGTAVVHVQGSKAVAVLDRLPVLEVGIRTAAVRVRMAFEDRRVPDSTVGPVGAVV